MNPRAARWEPVQNHALNESNEFGETSQEQERNAAGECQAPTILHRPRAKRLGIAVRAPDLSVVSTQDVNVSRPSNVPNAGEALFSVVSRWIESGTVAGAVTVEKAPKAGLYQLVET